MIERKVKEGLEWGVEAPGGLEGGLEECEGLGVKPGASSGVSIK